MSAIGTTVVLRAGTHDLGASARDHPGMTKHEAGKYGRIVGSKERKALVNASNGVWCYMCERSHKWSPVCEEKAARIRAQFYG